MQCSFSAVQFIEQVLFTLGQLQEKYREQQQLPFIHYKGGICQAFPSD